MKKSLVFSAFAVALFLGTAPVSAKESTLKDTFNEKVKKLKKCTTRQKLVLAAAVTAIVYALARRTQTGRDVIQAATGIIGGGATYLVKGAPGIPKAQW